MSKTILITGSSTGIGAATALFLAEENQIFVHYNSSGDEAMEVAAEVNKRGGTAFTVQADLLTEAGCNILMDYVESRVDSLDVLINNAGGMVKRMPVDGIDRPTLEKIFALNVYSAMYVTSRAVSLLKKGTDPSIINLSSVAIRHGAPTATAYGAAKAALDSYTRGIAKELAPAIRVNAVAPGVILTPFHDNVSDEEKLENFRKATPLQRNGEANHIAQVIAMLIENDFITGETIDVNGGIFMR